MDASPSERRSKRREGGFTLLEMLVALVVLGILVAGLAQGVKAGLTIWDAQSRRLAETADLDAAARVLRSLLSDIPTVPSALGTAPAIAIAGEADHLTLVADLPTGFGTTRRAEVTLALDGERFVLQWRPHRHERSQAPQPPLATAELVSGVRGLEFAYWGVAPGTRAAAWLGHWDGPAMPALIRVRLGFAKDDIRRWPDLLVAPRLAMPTG